MASPLLLTPFGRPIEFCSVPLNTYVDGAMTELCPPMLPEVDGQPFVDDCYSAGELADKSYDELRSIAAAHPDDDIHGRMGKDELRAELEGRERV